MTESLDDFLQQKKEAEASQPPAPTPATEKVVVTAFLTMSSTGSEHSEKTTAENDAGSSKIVTQKSAEASKNQGVSPSVESTETKGSEVPIVDSVKRQNIDEDSVARASGLQTHNKRRRICFYPDAMVEEAWERLKESYVYYQNKPVGTLVAMDSTAEALNYNQVFGREFFPAGLACLMKDPAEPEIVRNFLLNTLHLQGREKKLHHRTRHRLSERSISSILNSSSLVVPHHLQLIMQFIFDFSFNRS